MNDVKPSADDSRDSTLLTRSLKASFGRLNRVLKKKWPSWVNWLCVAVIVPAFTVMGGYILHLSQTIEDIRQDQKLTASEQSREQEKKHGELAQSLRDEHTKNQREAFTEAASQKKAFELLSAEMKASQQLHQARWEKELQVALARQKEVILQEQRQRIDGLQLFADSFELSGKLADANDAKRYRDTIAMFQEYCKKTPANDIPQAMRKFIYFDAARAFSIHGAYESIADAEFAEMQKHLREETPGTLTHLYIATIHLGKGQVEKARSRCKQGIDALVETDRLNSSRYVCAPYGAADLTDYYGMLILIELSASKATTEEGKLAGCWAVLDACEEKAIVYPAAIGERLERSALLAMSKHLNLAQPGFNRALKTMIAQLEEYVYTQDFTDFDARSLKNGEFAKCKVRRVKRSELTRPSPMPKPKDDPK